MDSQTPPPSPERQPKIFQRMLMRFAIGLFIVAALIFGYQKWAEGTKDPDMPTDNDTSGMLAAIELLEEGSQLVAIRPDGAIERSPDYDAGKTDREPIWLPNGNGVFFLSDREEASFNMYRWNFASNKITRRSVGTRSQGSASFAPASVPGANDSMLITSGGVVLEFFPKESRTVQVLPPVLKDRGNEEESSAGQFERIYRQLGTSFRLARWSKDKRYVAAIMRREDESEILIIQDVESYDKPSIVVAGQRVEVELNPVSGEFVFVANGFRYPDPNMVPPEAIKNGKVVVPFTSIVGQVDPKTDQGVVPILTTGDPKIGFQRLRVAPDGANLAIVAGANDANAVFEPKELLVIPAKAQGGRELKRMIAGRIFEPSWGPDSRTLAFVMYDEQKKRSIFTLNTDGSSLTNVTKGKGDFSFPEFSPQGK